MTIDPKPLSKEEGQQKEKAHSRLWVDLRMRYEEEVLPIFEEWERMNAEMRETSIKLD